MAVKKTEIAAAVAVPASILIGGANLVEWLTSLTGHPMQPETSYTVVSAFYAGIQGILIWLKKR